MLNYCWWKKSCTTWDVWNPIKNGIFTISTGARFLPSTVSISRVVSSVSSVWDVTHIRKNHQHPGQIPRRFFENRLRSLRIEIRKIKSEPNLHLGGQNVSFPGVVTIPRSRVFPKKTVWAQPLHLSKRECHILRRITGCFNPHFKKYARQIGSYPRR